MILHNQPDLMITASALKGVASEEDAVLLSCTMLENKTSIDTYWAEVDLKRCSSLFAHQNPRKFRSVKIEMARVLPDVLNQSPRQYDQCEGESGEVIRVPYGYRVSDNMRPFDQLDLLFYPRTFNAAHTVKHRTVFITVGYGHTTPYYIDLLPPSPFV